MKTKTTLLFLTFILCACTRTFSTPETLPVRLPTDTVTPQTEAKPVIDIPTKDGPTGPKIIVTVGTPNIGLPPDGEFPTPSTSQQNCAFTWAYRDLPELTAEFDAAIKTLNPNAITHASAFGEDCIGEGGKVVRFGAMETDFYVSLSVNDLTDYESFGTWIAQVMQVVNVLPPDMLAGPNPGFVEFRFQKNKSESIGFRVPIQQYNTSANEKTGEELFRMFYNEP